MTKSVPQNRKYLSPILRTFDLSVGHSYNNLTNRIIKLVLLINRVQVVVRHIKCQRLAQFVHEVHGKLEA